MNVLLQKQSVLSLVQMLIVGTVKMKQEIARVVNQGSLVKTVNQNAPMVCMEICAKTSVAIVQICHSVII